VAVAAAVIVLARLSTRHCEGFHFAKLDCDLMGIGLVVAIDASLFALLVLGWWLLTGLDGLKRIFEINWPGLDGGDVDTIGAMAGALWGIVNGAERLPPLRLEARDMLVDVATRMFRRQVDPD